MAASAINARTLLSAFDAFNRKADLLEAEYRELKGTVAKLTRRLQAEQSARHRELLDKERLGDRLSRLFDVLPGAVLIIDGAGIVREHNDRALELLNCPLVGCPWADIVRREFSPGRSADGELKLRDGRWLSLSRRKLANEPGAILLLCDVSESRRMAELLHRHQRLSGLGEMSARLAHQLRTPLASAVLYASQLETCGGERERKAAGKVAARLRDLSHMIDDMLGYCGGARTAGECFAVADLVREVIAELGGNVPPELEVIAGASEPSLTLTANRGALKGALQNLVNNAAQACGARGRVEVSACVCDGRVCLTVRDDGPGLSGEARSRLFEPFYTTRPDGTGLGLAVVRSVAEAHGGHVVFHSERGSTVFAICIPATSGVVAESSPREARCG